MLEYALKRSMRDIKKKGRVTSETKETEHEITSALIIDEKGANLGCMNVAEARALAASQGMYLALVSGNVVYCAQVVEIALKQG